MSATAATLAEQLRWGAAVDADAPAADRVLFAGMGGSAMAAAAVSLLAGAAGAHAPVHRSYGLPPWAGDGALVALSYSGNTEETISAVEEATARGMAVAAVAAGGTLAKLAAEGGWPLIEVPAGLQPRAALGYQAAAAARLLEAMGIAPGTKPVLTAAADAAEAAATESGETVSGIAKSALDAVTVVYGGTDAAVLAARRWKTQINENAKSPAFWSALPEAGHNDIEGWTRPAGRVVAVFLRDQDEGKRLTRRIDLTRQLLAGDIDVAGEVWAQGDHPLARFFSLVVTGDAVSLAMAEAAGVDADSVPRIEMLKRELGRQQ